MGASTFALAQQQEGKIETVQITGTRITTPGATSNNPISSISAEEIKAAQPVAVEEFFKGLPAAVPAVGPGTNNGTGGAATIDLRGLGTNRSLVLINGRRIVPYNLNGVVDTNAIPIALLNRVDLVTGGASVVYGADAVSGVANFNLKRNFTGVDLTSSYGVSGEGDGKRHRTDLTVGAKLDDNRGNVVMSLGKTKVDPVTQGSRPYGMTNLNSVTGAPTGSETGVPAGFSTGQATGGTSTLSGKWQIDPASGKLVQPLVPYNTNPLNYYQTALDRNQVTALGNYKINDWVEVYSDVFYTSSKVASTLAESGTFGNTFQVPIGNPYMPDAMRQQLCDRRAISAANCVVGNATMVPLLVDRRFVELGPRLNNFDTRTLQYTVGLKGDLPYEWNYDAYFSRGISDQTQTRQNWGSLSKVGQALNALSKTSCVNPANGCVPLNVFGAAGSITPEMLKFINLSALLMQSVQQDVSAISVSGDLGQKIKSPWADNPIAMSLSAEQRKMIAGTQSDSASQIQGEVLGTGAPLPDRSGSFRMREEAIELAIPVVSKKPFIEALNLEAGYRHTEFTTVDSRSYGSWKGGGEWQPVKSLRFRGMVQKATRAPNVNELFAPQVTGLSNLAVDPCQGNRINKADANTAGTLSNLCRLTGVPASEIGSLPAPSSGQINYLSGGNPNLGPEEAKTKTLGLVWEPVSRMMVSLDWYKINIDKAVSSPSTTDILDGCYSAALNPGLTMNTACGMIGRNTLNGTFNGVESRGVLTPQSNLGTQSTSGWDLNAAYRFNANQLGLDSKWGNFDASFMYTQVQSYKFRATPASIERDCLGHYSVACANIVNAPVFKRKFNQRANWNLGSFSVGYNWRYIGAVDVEPGATKFLPEFSHIKAYNYLDLSGVYNYNKHVRFNVSVNNVANKKPPIVGGTIGGTGPNSGNTFPQTYDAIGRYLTFGASVKF
ncbi:TonB-dependent receptor domain-containing protein [Massilia horti]|uniref:TonB-dependent receptor n=1 Tax=Massilia horti TaxID=2562153 RepID=A0A4Y9SPG2_9BURK|nr:TonB-dependent receptor [Massilia horti]TFW28652.1 TonB-dependent receptor [Massilia horti]